MAVDALYKDWEGRVQLLEAEVRRQTEAYGRLQLENGEERAMRTLGLHPAIVDILGREIYGRLQVQGGGDWYGRFMAVEALYKDRDSRVQILEVEVRK